jgi:uncharacterized protein
MSGKPNAADYARRLTLQRIHPRIVKLELILTESCNLDCSYCFQADKSAPRRMSRDVAYRAIEFLMDASRDAEEVMIGFIGGEPMLHYDLLRDCIFFAKERASERKKRVFFEMTTNGTMLTEEHARFFRRAGLKYLLSLDGIENENDLHRLSRRGCGTAREVIEKLPMLKRYQPWLGSRMTVTPESAGHIRKNVEFLHRRKINQFIIGFAAGVEWTDDDIVSYGQGLKELFEFYLGETLAKGDKSLRIGLFEGGNSFESALHRRIPFGCGAGSQRLSVSTAGEYYGCSKLASVMGFRNGILPLGDVHDGISNVSNRISLLNDSSAPRLKCKDCLLSARCQGGCYADNYRDTGNIYVPADYYCKLIFAQMEACNYARGRKEELGLQ